MFRTVSVNRCWYWPALTGTIALIACLGVLNSPRLAECLGVHQLGRPFIDWLAILAASDAQQAGANPYANPNPFDPLGRPHIYGPWWLLLGDLGFTSEDYWWTGALLVLLFICSAVAVLAP